MDNIFPERLKQALAIRKMSPAELSERSGISKASISEYLAGKYEPRQRSIYLLSQALRVDPTALLGVSELKIEPVMKDIPVLSIIEQGNPIIASKNIEKYEKTDETEVSFALRVNDDGMINARIARGDLVYVEENTLIENADIVVALPDEKEAAVIRRYYRYGEKLALHPEHPNMTEETYSPKELLIIGKVVGAKFSIR